MALHSLFPSGGEEEWRWATLNNDIGDIPSGAFPYIVSRGDDGAPVSYKTIFATDAPILVGSCILSGRYDISGACHPFMDDESYGIWVVDGNVTVSNGSPQM